MARKTTKAQSGFTIVELLVVIVVIGVLAIIVAVSYSGIQQRAIVASLQSDLNNSSTQLKLYQVLNDAYPTSLDSSNCFIPIGSEAMCLRNSTGGDYIYTSDNNATPQTFTLDITNDDIKYRITNDSAPIAVSVTCPSGFIIVPGSSTYSTSDFCVMKYEARNVSGTAVSQPTGTPWVSISQPNAAIASANACTGCRLITEPEWLTIAQNVLSVPSNWSSGVVGTGFIYSGHNDGAPNNSLASSTDDDGYYGTLNTTPSNQRRTLTLTNGEIIWDLSGNVLEWTTGTSQAPVVQPGSPTYAWREWTAIANPGTVIPDPSPSNTGLPGSDTWNSTKGIGFIYSDSAQTGLRGFSRGSNWYFGHAGILTLFIRDVPGNPYTYCGFRATAPWGN
ncbi:MAG: prepilin-type N-terminal cleavage/methylation domain-containing protein [Candidatus Saccharimonadales bacterium]